MPFTAEELSIILRAIQEDKSFRNKLGIIAEDIVDKIYSYYTNPNCTCKSNIIEWVNKNEDKTRELINTFSTTFEKLKQTQATPPPAPSAPTTTQTAPQNVKIGETLVIDPSPEAYKKLFDTIKAERWIFRGMQVIPGEDNGKDVWFILFY